MATRYLSNITINDAYTLPSADGTAGQVMTTDGSGAVTFETISDGQTVKVACKNTSGSTITKGTPVYITGTVGTSFTVQIAPANASSAATMPALGLLETDLANNGEGFVVTGGLLKNLTTDPIDSSTPSSNDTVYVKPGGGLTLTKPSGTNLIQNIGKVGRVNSSNSGSLVVSSIMRTNDVPAPLYVDVANQKVGIGDSTPTVSLDISATDAVQMPSGTTAQRPTGVNGMFRYNNTDNQFEGYADGEWGAIAGGGSVEVEKNIYTGDGSDVTFDTTSTIVSENNVQVYLDGVYQSKDNYTTSGNTVTFSTAPSNGVSVELIHILSANATIIIDTLSGDGSTTGFTLTANVADENNTQVYIDGVYQSKDNYSTSGNTITFSTAPSNGTSIEVVNIKPVNTNQVAAGTVYEEQLSVTNTPTDGYVLTYDSATTGFTWEQKFDGDITGIVAGDGLTGDATSGDASLAVGAGTGITVNANDVQISDGGVGTTQLAADAVTNAKIADDSIDSEHYVDGSIDTAHIADSQITTAKIADDAVTGAKIADNVALAGSPTTTTQLAGDNSTKIATTAYADAAVANVIDSAPAALDTLNELAAALGDDANFASTVTTSLAGKLSTSAGAVGTSNLAADAVTTAKIADDAVTIAKIADAAIVIESEGISSNDNDTTIPTSAAVKDYVDSQGIGVSVISTNTTATTGNLYVLTANLTLTLPASPSVGNYIKVSNRSGVATCTIARNSENIMGAASDLTLDKLNSGFELIYSGSTEGWILIGVEGA